MPIDFEGANITLTKPESMTDEQCTPLRAMYGRDESTGFPYFITAWMPNKEDLEAINSGKPIYLQMITSSFPPSSLFTVNETGETNE